MDIIKIAGVSLIGITIISILKQYRPEFTIYISLIAGIIIISIVIGKLDGIIQILKSLSEKSTIDKEFLNILLKVTGIAILTEYISSVCKDAGEHAIANKVNLRGKLVIMSLSIPIISGLLETITAILP